MPIIARGFLDERQLAEEVEQTARELDPKDVRDLQFRIGTDHDGDPSSFSACSLPRMEAGNPGWPR
jgi:hypothetical protein